MQIPKEWLTERVENVPTTYHRSLAPGAALRTRMAWQKVMGRAEQGDEVWGFTSPRSRWPRRTRYVGFALVRDGRVIDSAVIRED